MKSNKVEGLYDINFQLCMMEARREAEIEAISKCVIEILEEILVDGVKVLEIGETE